MSEAKRTRPPNHYTDATLIQAMSNIARFVEDRALAKVLRDTDGIGTEATRASMIETLEKRGYIIRSQRLLLPTELGHCLIKSLPERAVSADLTAQWERQLDDIVNEKGGYQAFMDTLLRGVNELLIDSDHRDLQDLPAKYQAPACPKCDSPLRRAKSKRGWFWGCTNTACDYTANDRNGMPGGPRRSTAKSSAKKDADKVH
jgi:DNA topoisomerase-3